MMRTLAVSLGELDLDLTAADPLAVQVVERVLCVADVLERARRVKAFGGVNTGARHAGTGFKPSQRHESITRRQSDVV